MNQEYDVAIVGGGIVGLAHAWMAARRNLRVVLLDRSAVAEGASVRNFGMIWPIGQPAGELYATALRSRELWLELGVQGVLPVEECGSLHLAHRPDELAVLEEFCGLATHDCRILTADETIQRSPLANPDHLLGALESLTELRVNPRIASAQIAGWLTDTRNVKCCFQTAVTQINGHTLHASDGRTCHAERIVVCSGSDLQTLYPHVFQSSGLKLCKLQMLKASTRATPHRSTMHIASGLTLRHYTSFRACPSLNQLCERVAEETPELDRFGIHVMASQFPNGDVILGDSHEYGAEITPFDQPEIDELMLRELRKVIQLEDWGLCERWHGIYAKHPHLPVFEAAPESGVQIFVGPGGAGMTMSFGLAERAWNNWLGSDQW